MTHAHECTTNTRYTSTSSTRIYRLVVDIPITYHKYIYYDR